MTAIDTKLAILATQVQQAKDAAAGALAPLPASGLPSANLIGFTQAGSNAKARAVQDKLRDTVSVKDFGAVGDGVADDAPAIQAALDSGRAVYLPNGIYRLGSAIKITSVGQKLRGESCQETYLITPAGSSHDILRVAASLADISGIMFRPGSINNICVRAYAGWMHLHGNRFLSAAPQSGTALVLTDQNPDAGFVPGAYTHLIEGNHFGAAGYTFARDIDDYSANGITATKFMFNQHLCDFPLRLVRGGGNTYFGNLFQSATGTSGTKIGTCLDFGTGVVGESVTHNYFELYATALVSRITTNTNQSFRATHNHYDNVGQQYSTSASNFIQEDGVGLSELKNGWTNNYSSATQRVFNGPTGGTPILTLDDANKAIKINKTYTPLTNLSFTADGQTQTPTQEVMVITGNGAARANCILGTTGVQDGQVLELMGVTWPVTLLNTTIRFASNATSVSFGNTSGHVQNMTFRYRAADGKWWERSRATY